MIGRNGGQTMAIQEELFNIETFDGESGLMDDKKARINRALRFLRPEFLKIAETEMAERQQGKMHISLHTHQWRGCILMFTVSRGHAEYADGFNIIMYDSTKETRTVIASSKLVAAAEGIPSDRVGACFSLFDGFATKILEHFSPTASTTNPQASHKIVRRVA
ncbi:MAG TPA: hypothetical protein VIJ29_00230 [Candidatus Paceibacterota bacterium]